MNVTLGEEVLQIEYGNSYPNGVAKFKGVVTRIESSFIEVMHQKPNNIPWLIDLCKNLAPIHRTYYKTWTKNYFDNNGNINIEKLC
jgi:hypothetical protein